MSEENVKAREVSGFISQEPKTRNINTKNGIAPVMVFSVGTQNEEGVDFTNIRVSEKFFDNVKELKPGNKVTVVGYPKSYDYKDNEGNNQTYHYLQLAKEVSVEVDQKVNLSGNLANVMKLIEFENGSKLTFEMGVNDSNNKPGDKDQTKWYTVNIGKNFMKESDLAKKGDLVGVEGYLKEKSYQKNDGNFGIEKIIYVSAPVKVRYSKTQSENKSENKSEGKSEDKSENKSEGKSEDKLENKSEDKSKGESKAKQKIKKEKQGAKMGM